LIHFYKRDKMRLLVDVSVLCILVHSSQALRFMVPDTTTGNDMVCPVAEGKPNLDIRRFMGHWYILEYQYPRSMELGDLSCLSFQFQESNSGILGNFTFRFPPRFGHFYHIPTVSNVLANGQEGLWMTQFKGVDLLTAVVDTDYNNWAVFVQCINEAGQNKFMSTRVMSRTPDLSPQHWLNVREVIKGSSLEAEFKYEIDQSTCDGNPTY